MNFAVSVPGFRRCDKGNMRHRLNDIIILMILGRTCGHVGYSDIIEFGNHNLNKFRKMGMLKNVWGWKRNVRCHVSRYLL